MKYILNIGRAVAGSDRLLTVMEIHDALRAEGFTILHSSTHLSGTEPTQVVEVDDHGADFRKPSIYSELAEKWLSMEKACTVQINWGCRLAVRLHQEAIAVWCPALNAGGLRGPQVFKWGSFNPEFFVMPNGTKLSEQ